MHVVIHVIRCCILHPAQDTGDSSTKKSANVSSHQQSSAVIRSLQRLAQIIKGHRAGDDVKGPDAVSTGKSAKPMWSLCCHGCRCPWSTSQRPKATSQVMLLDGLGCCYLHICTKVTRVTSHLQDYLLYEYV